MAVRILPHASGRVADRAVSVPGAILALALVPSAIDLLKLVQPALEPFLFVPVLAASGLAALLLMAMWVRYPRAAWLAAASFAAFAAVMLRFVGADIAPLLSLLAIVALGVGGGFASREVSPANV